MTQNRQIIMCVVRLNNQLTRPACIMAVAISVCVSVIWYPVFLFCQYLGKTHNSWHRSGLMLEDYASLCDDYSSNQISHQQQQVIDFSPFEEDPSEINQHVRNCMSSAVLIWVLQWVWFALTVNATLNLSTFWSYIGQREPLKSFWLFSHDSLLKGTRLQMFRLGAVVKWDSESRKKCHYLGESLETQSSIEPVITQSKCLQPAGNAGKESVFARQKLCDWLEIVVWDFQANRVA